MNEQSLAIIAAIRAVPPGKVSSYGAVARAAWISGHPSPPGARQVARILHSCSRSHNLPWHRIVNSRGRISLPRGGGFEEQAARLKGEGVVVSDSGKIGKEFIL